jgi:4-hydroxy-3-methylbut-2-enyl diphosphate reductase
MAQEQARREPTTILGQLVHNDDVNRSLRNAGVRIVDSETQLDSQTVMISAHRASDRKVRRLKNRGLKVLEATCPLVRFAHKAVRRLAEQGYHPVIVGKRGHVEVNGLTEDLEEFDIVLTDEDIEALTPRRRFGVAAQTTQPIQWVRDRVETLKRCFPEADVLFADTVCQPTKQRQTAAEKLAMEADVILVIGGRNSNNTHMLVKTCAQYGARTHHIQGADDLIPDWFEEGQTVGLTAGTSTPDSLVDEVERAIEQIARSRVCSGFALHAD